MSKPVIRAYDPTTDQNFVLACSLRAGYHSGGLPLRRVKQTQWYPPMHRVMTGLLTGHQGAIVIMVADDEQPDLLYGFGIVLPAAEERPPAAVIAYLRASVRGLGVGRLLFGAMAAAVGLDAADPSITFDVAMPFETWWHQHDRKGLEDRWPNASYAPFRLFAHP